MPIPTTGYYRQTDIDYARQERTSAEKSRKKSSNKTIAVTSCFVIATYRGPGVCKRYPFNWMQQLNDDIDLKLPSSHERSCWVLLTVVLCSFHVV